MSEPHESRVYSDLARFYDVVFGWVFADHEREVIESINFRPGQKLLEVGVGTGIALDAYPPYVHIVGVDPAEDMLRQAVTRATENGWNHVELARGDALALEFPDRSFDYVLSFHVMTVVPDPAQMMREMIRVCKPGGRIVVVTHFASDHPLLFFFGSIANPITKLLGWTTRLRARDVLNGHKITVERYERFSRLSVHYVLIARKEG